MEKRTEFTACQKVSSWQFVNHVCSYTPFPFDFVSKQYQRASDAIGGMRDSGAHTKTKPKPTTFELFGKRTKPKNVNSYHIIIASQPHTYTHRTAHHLCGLISGAQTSFALVKIVGH